MTLRRLLVVLAAALVAGTAGILGLTAAQTVWNDQGAAVVLATGAVFFARPLRDLCRPRRRPASKWARVYGGKPMPEHIYIRHHRRRHRL